MGSLNGSDQNDFKHLKRAARKPAPPFLPGQSGPWHRELTYVGKHSDRQSKISLQEADA